MKRLLRLVTHSSSFFGNYHTSNAIVKELNAQYFEEKEALKDSNIQLSSPADDKKNLNKDLNSLRTDIKKAAANKPRPESV